MCFWSFLQTQVNTSFPGNHEFPERWEKTLTAENNKLVQAQTERERNETLGKSSAYILLCQLPLSTGSFYLVYQELHLGISIPIRGKQTKKPQTNLQHFPFFWSSLSLSENAACRTRGLKQNAFCHSRSLCNRASKGLKTIAWLVLVPWHKNFLFASRND